METLKGTQVTIRVKPDAVPHFVRERRIPYVLHNEVDKELKQLQEAGVINPVDFSEWAAPIHHCVNPWVTPILLVSRGQLQTLTKTFS